MRLRMNQIELFLQRRSLYCGIPEPRSPECCTHPHDGYLMGAEPKTDQPIGQRAGTFQASQNPSQAG